MLPLIGSRATCLILHPASSAINDHDKKDAPSLTYGVGRAISRARQLHILQKPNAGSTGDLLRVDFVKAENPGNKQSDGGEMLQQGMSTDAAGLCAGSSIVFWKNRLKPLRTSTNVEEGLLKKGCAEGGEWCRERVGYKVRKEEYKDD